MKILKEKINKKAIEICEILQNYGYQAYIVGGCVRDLIIDHNPKDWDITTDALPEQVIQIFPRTYSTGLKHGTVTVSMGEGTENHFEVTTFRVEGKYMDGRRPEEVSFVKDLKEDLARRDLTINAIAYDPISESLFDPFDGKSDLKNKIIKTVGNPNDRFREDGLRVMRAARFAARLNYQIEKNTLEAMSNNIETLLKVSKERIKDELCKTLMTRHPAYGISILIKTNILKSICPILHNDYLNHFIKSLDKCNKQLETRVACLFINVKTPLIEKQLLDLKFSNSEIKRILFLSSLIDEYSENFKKEDSLSSYIYFISYLKNNSVDSVLFTLDQFTSLMRSIEIDVMLTLTKYKDHFVWSRKEMQINGNDLITLGVKPGPVIKLLLDKCYQEILFVPNKNNTEYLTSYVKTLL